MTAQAAGASPAADDMSSALEARGLSKQFGSAIALADVSFSARSGQVTCLLGDNGAGKSTLIKILAGFHEPTGGELIINGEPRRFDSPKAARTAGVSVVYQDLAMQPLMSIWRNFHLGEEPMVGWGPTRRIDATSAKRVCRQELEAMGIDIRDPEQPVGTLSGGERQSVAIARAVYFGAKVLILDEPTSALGVRQSGAVLKLIAAASRRGLAVIFITHSPAHAELVGDRFVLLRRGRCIGDYEAGKVTRQDLIEQMSGGADLEALEHELGYDRRSA